MYNIMYIIYIILYYNVIHNILLYYYIIVYYDIIYYTQALSNVLQA